MADNFEIRAAYRLVWHFPDSPVLWNLTGRELGGLDWLRERKAAGQAQHPERVYEIRFLEWSRFGPFKNDLEPFEGAVVPDSYQEPVVV